MAFTPFINAFEDLILPKTAPQGDLPTGKFYTQATPDQLEHIVRACGFFGATIKIPIFNVYDHESGLVKGTLAFHGPELGRSLDDQFRGIEAPAESATKDPQYLYNSSFSYKRKGRRRKGVPEVMTKVTVAIMRQLNRKLIPAYWKIEYGGPIMIANNFDEIKPQSR